MEYNLSSAYISAHDLITLKIPSRIELSLSPLVPSSTELSSSSLVQSYTKPVLSPSTNPVSLPSTKSVIDVHTQPSFPVCSPKASHSFCPTSTGFLQPFGFPIGYSMQRSVGLFLPSGSASSSLTQSSPQSSGNLSPPLSLCWSIRLGLHNYRCLRCQWGSGFHLGPSLHQFRRGSLSSWMSPGSLWALDARTLFHGSCLRPLLHGSFHCPHILCSTHRLLHSGFSGQHPCLFPTFRQLLIHHQSPHPPSLRGGIVVFYTLFCMFLTTIT